MLQFCIGTDYLPFTTWFGYGLNNPEKTIKDYDDTWSGTNFENCTTDNTTFNLYSLWSKELQLTFDLNDGYLDGSPDSIQLKSKVYNKTYKYTFGLYKNPTPASIPQYTAQNQEFDAYGNYDDNGINTHYTKSTDEGVQYRFLGWSVNSNAEIPDTNLDVYSASRNIQLTVYNNGSFYAVYFNLLPDSSPNYANPDSTLQRNEFMAMVFRAETPVQDLEADTAFSDAVGASDYNIYAQGIAQNSYLDLASKSLNNLTANGTITREEAIYTIVSRYFADELKNVDTKGVTFTDAKDGGNIAEQQKFIEDGTQKDYWKSYELTYALQNPDNGLPTDLFKALAVAKDKGLITSETRWDEALTKSEAIELLVTALMQETGVTEFNAKQGIIEGYEVEINTKVENEANNEDSSINSTHTDVVLGDDEYKGDNEATTTDTSGIVSESDRELLDSIWAELEKENPDLFVSPEPSTTQQSNYESVGTSDSGQFTNPNYTVGESGSEGINPGTIY